MKGFLTPEQLAELLHELRVERYAKYSDRIKVILLLDKGWTHEKISEALFLDEGTIRNYRKRYVEGGVLGLVNDMHSGRRCQLSPKELQLLSVKLSEEIFLEAKEVAAYIKERFEVEYSVSGVTSLLHSLGFVYKKAKAIPGKADREKQELFIKEYLRLKAKSEGKIYFADSVHPRHNSIISYGWIKKGDDFEVLSNTGRYHLNITGAIDIESMEMVTRSCQWVNADSICELLKSLRTKHLYGEVIHLILDNARYNRSWKVKELACDLGIELMYLPPYSPNLNPIERVWKFFKKKVLYNRYYESKAEFDEVCLKFFKYIRKFKDELSTLVTDNFEVFGT
jgi:transposase